MQQDKNLGNFKLTSRKFNKRDILCLEQSEGKLQRKLTSTVCQHNLIDAIAF